MIPIEELTLKTASLSNILTWLTQPHGPHLVDGTLTKNLLMALAILVSPEVLDNPDSPLVGLGLVYKALYIQTASWSEAYFKLKLISQARASSQPTEAKVIFMQIEDSSQVIPLPGVHTLFLDVKTPEDITDSKVPQPPRDFRDFQLHRIILTGVNPPIAQVAIPCLQGSTVCCWTPMQKQVLPPELEEVPQVTVALITADPNHWNIVNDPIYPSCLDIFKARHKASTASEAATLAGGASS